MHRTRDKMTVGLTSTLAPEDPKFDDYRFFFFETDLPYNAADYNRLVTLYEHHNLDVLVHRTGSGGLHFKSPTLVLKEEWKEMMDEVKDINPQCPMITLRTKPNKYVAELDVWKLASVGTAGAVAEQFNSMELCFLLNKWFGSKFKGSVNTILRFVNYPFPEVKT